LLNAKTGDWRASVSSTQYISPYSSPLDLILTGSASTFAEIYLQSRGNKIAKFVENKGNFSLELKWQKYFSYDAYDRTDNSGMMLKINE
jgi:hypothetical protein